MQCGILVWIPERKKDTGGQTGEIRIESIVLAVVLCQCSFLSFDNCTMGLLQGMLTLGKEWAGALGLSSQPFCKSKIISKTFKKYFRWLMDALRTFQSLLSNPGQNQSLFHVSFKSTLHNSLSPHLFRLFLYISFKNGNVLRVETRENLYHCRSTSSNVSDKVSAQLKSQLPKTCKQLVSAGG